MLFESRAENNVQPPNDCPMTKYKCQKTLSIVRRSDTFTLNARKSAPELKNGLGAPKLVAPLPPPPPPKS